MNKMDLNGSRLSRHQAVGSAWLLPRPGPCIFLVVVGEFRLVPGISDALGAHEICNENYSGPLATLPGKGGISAPTPALAPDQKAQPPVMML